jgi:hypothetical protein
MIAEFITALPTIISLLERKDTDSPLPSSPISDAIAEFKTEIPVVTPPITPPITAGIPIIPIKDLPTGEWYKPIEFDPWWLKENGYKGIQPLVPVPPTKRY